MDRDLGVKTVEEVADIAGELRNEGKVIVTTNGSFDIYHVGHVRLFSRIKILGDVLIVLVNSDDSIRKNKGAPRPYNNESDRAEVVSYHRDVDYVSIFTEDTPLTSLEIIRPDIHAKGGTYDSSRTDKERELVEGWGGKFKFLPLDKGYSSTDIEQLILERNRQLRGKS